MPRAHETGQQKDKLFNNQGRQNTLPSWVNNLSLMSEPFSVILSDCSKVPIVWALQIFFFAYEEHCTFEEIGTGQDVKNKFYILFHYENYTLHIHYIKHYTLYIINYK